MVRKAYMPAPIERLRMGSLLSLVAVFMGPAQIIPGLLALSAALEGSHTVQIGNDGSALHLILSHERGNNRRTDFNPKHQPWHCSHRHGLAARMLCLLSVASGREPDHTATFSTGSAWEENSGHSSHTADEIQSSQQTVLDTLCEAANPISLLVLHNHGPPATSALSILLRSVVLLV